MALATKCPHCQTTFRVVNDQLKLRAGLVRCGHCKEIFNGIEHLLPPTPLEPKSAAAAEHAGGSATISAAAPSAAPAITQHELVDVVKTMMVSTPAPAVENEPGPAAETSFAYADSKPEIAEASDEADHQAHHAIEAETTDTANDQIAKASGHDMAKSLAADLVDQQSDQPPREISHPTATSYWRKDIDHQPQGIAQDPLQRMTLMDFTRELPDQIESNADHTGHQEVDDGDYAQSVSINPQTDDELDAAIEDLQRKPWRKAKKNRTSARDSYAETDDEEPNFVKRGRRQQRLGKKIRLFLGVASVLLFLIALAQGAYIFRDQLAGMYPQTKPALVKMCEFLSCRIKLPAQISMISIESSELQTLATGKDTFVLTALLHNKSRTAQEWPNIELTLNDNNEKPLLRRVFTPSDYINTQTDITQGLPPDNERAVKLNFALSQIKASGYRVYLFYP